MAKTELGPRQNNEPLRDNLPGMLRPEHAFATGGHMIAYDKEVPCAPRQPTTWGVKPENPNEPQRSYVKFIFRYRPMQWLLRYHVVTLPGPTPRMSSMKTVMYNERPTPNVGSPDPQGVMLGPSRSTTSSRSKKGKEPERDRTPATNVSGSPSIVSFFSSSLVGS